MSKSLPSLNSLRAFEAAARHLSFTRAAEELHVTPAAVSQLIKSLEDHIGVALFHRLTRGLALTDAGLAGLPQLQKAFCMLSKGVDVMRGSLESDLLAVQSAPSFAAKWLLTRLPRFSAAHPEVDLRIAGSLEQIDSRARDVDARDTFRSGEVQIGIRFGTGEYTGCRVDPLLRIALVPLCSPALLTGEQPLRVPADLRHHTLLHDETPAEALPQWDTWLSAAGVDNVSPARGPHYNSTQLVLQAAMEGQGVALGIDVLAADDVEAGRLVVPFDVHLPVESAYYMVTLEETADLARIAAFREWILAEASGFRKTLDGRVPDGVGRGVFDAAESIT